MSKDEKLRRAYLISIRPKFAYQIFARQKKFELRRWIGIPIEPGSTIVVYVSGNVKAIVGEFKVGKVIVGPPRKVWDEVMKYPKPGIDEDDWPYIAGSKKAMAIEVLDPIIFVRPVKLEELRNIIPGFMPPLSYRVLYEGEPLSRMLIDYLRRQTKPRLSSKHEITIKEE